MGVGRQYVPNVRLRLQALPRVSVIVAVLVRRAHRLGLRIVLFLDKNGVGGNEQNSSL